jgi:hypothetical protein
MWEVRMDTIRDRVAGLDVHRDTVVACVRLADRRKVSTEKKTFSTMSSGVSELADWLAERDVSTAVMEATGVYWKPVVRHEAPCDRGEVRGLPRAVAAAC